MQLKGIPMVPSMNNAYPSDKFGRRFKSKAFKLWEGEFRIWCLSHAHDVNEARRTFAQPSAGRLVRIHAQYWFNRSSILCKNGKPKRNDTSNRLKILHDAVSEAIWLDDSYFFDGTFTKRPFEDQNLIKPEICNVILEWMEAPWMINALK